MRSSSVIWPVLLGVSAGAIASLVVWKYADAQLQKQLQQGFAQGGTALSAQLTAGQRRLQQEFLASRVQAELEIQRIVIQTTTQQVDTQIRQALNSYGLTPDRTRWLAAQIDWLRTVRG